MQTFLKNIIDKWYMSLDVFERLCFDNKKDPMNSCAAGPFGASIPGCKICLEVTGS